MVNLVSWQWRRKCCVRWVAKHAVFWSEMGIYVEWSYHQVDGSTLTKFGVNVQIIWKPIDYKEVVNAIYRDCTEPIEHYKNKRERRRTVGGSLYLLHRGMYLRIIIDFICWYKSSEVLFYTLLITRWCEFPILRKQMNRGHIFSLCGGCKNHKKSRPFQFSGPSIWVSSAPPTI